LATERVVARMGTVAKVALGDEVASDVREAEAGLAALREVTRVEAARREEVRTRGTRRTRESRTCAAIRTCGYNTTRHTQSVGVEVAGDGPARD